MGPELRFAIYAVGLGISFLLYGVLQERIITLPYGNGRMFDGVMFLVLVNRIVASLVAAAALYFLGRPIEPAASWRAYLMISSLNLSGAFAQYEAVKHISYPASVLLRSAKMIPVLFWGTLLRVRTFSKHDLMVALILSISCTFFLWSSSNASNLLPQSMPLLGAFYCVAFLFLDGLTSTSQDKLFRGHAAVHPFNLMFFVNFISICLSISSAFIIIILGGYDLILLFPFINII